MIERDFKIEHLFPTCFIATNPVKSLEFYSNLLYYYAAPFLANYGTVSYSLSFHSYSSAATSSATSKHGTVPERPIRNEEKSSLNVFQRCAVRPDVQF